MSAILVDSNVLLDVLTDDPEWSEWSSDALARWAGDAMLAISPIIYAEVSIRFSRIEELEEMLPESLPHVLSCARADLAGLASEARMEPTIRIEGTTCSFRIGAGPWHEWTTHDRPQARCHGSSWAGYSVVARLSSSSLCSCFVRAMSPVVLPSCMVSMAVLGTTTIVAFCLSPS